MLNGGEMKMLKLRDSSRQLFHDNKGIEVFRSVSHGRGIPSTETFKKRSSITDTFHNVPGMYAGLWLNKHYESNELNKNADSKLSTEDSLLSEIDNNASNKKYYLKKEKNN